MNSPISLRAAVLSATIAIPVAACLMEPPEPSAQPDSRNTSQPDRRNDPDRDANRGTGRDGMMGAQPGEMHQWLKQFAGNWNISVETFHDADAVRDPANPNDPNRNEADRNNSNRNDADKNNPNRSTDSGRRGGNPDKDTGTATTKMILEDRYAQMNVQCSKTHEMTDAKTGKSRAMNFEGMQLIGYNNETGKFESVWTDNHCTHVTVLTGELDSARKELTLTSDNVKIGDRMKSTTSSAEPANKNYSSKGSVRQVIRWTGPSSFVTEVYKSRGDSAAPDKQMVITFTKNDSGIMGSAPTSP